MAEFAPENWEVLAHHMTLLGPRNNKRSLPPRWIDKQFCVDIVGIAKNDKVMAALVDLKDLPIPMAGPEFPHVTIAVDRQAGGEPSMSNDFSQEDFERIEPIMVCGTTKEIMRYI